MTINRNNYEEYFLLYADNELSKTQRKIVEIFVQENPDLKEEFSMMKLTINSPDEKIKLLDKSFLLKKLPPFINENNYEEIFVLYHDDELSEKQKTETEKFIAENPKFNQDFELILNSKLIPENSIVYPAKGQLYRKEKSGKVLPMILWRSIAAAVFIGFGLWIGLPYFKKNDVVHPMASSTNTNIQKRALKEIKPGTNIIPKQPLAEENDVVSSANTLKPARMEQNKKETEKPVLKEQETTREFVAISGKKIEKEPLEEKIIISKPNVKQQLAVSDQQSEQIKDIIEKPETILVNEEIAIQEKEIKKESPEIVRAQTVSYVDADINNQNYVFYDVTTDEFKKSKVGGFLKKVRRVVERNNPITRLLTESDLVAK